MTTAIVFVLWGLAALLSAIGYTNVRLSVVMSAVLGMATVTAGVLLLTGVTT